MIITLSYHKTAICRRSVETENISHKTIDNFARLVYNNSTTMKEVMNMSITATELKQNLGKYLILSLTEDIFITKNGKIVAKLSNPYQTRVETATSLFGVLPNDMTLDEARAERLGAI